MPATYFVQRGRQYHLRLRVPTDLTHLFGRRELHRSLVWIWRVARGQGSLEKDSTLGS